MSEGKGGCDRDERGRSAETGDEGGNETNRGSEGQPRGGHCRVFGKENSRNGCEGRAEQR
jgi:hypothetical protein